jgi:hypothetical protein
LTERFRRSAANDLREPVMQNVGAHAVWGLAAVTALACGGKQRDEDLFGDGEGSLTAPSGSAEAATGDDDGEASAADDDDDTAPGTGDPSADSGDTIKLDVGDGRGSADEGSDGTGCDKVDFLFVIDNSGSMSDEQSNLIASFDGFIGAIQNTLEAQDYHVMVVSTDAGGSGGYSVTCTNGVCSCTPVPACCEQVCNGLSDSCNGFACDDLPGGECETTLGAGKIFEEDGTSCLPEDGPRYMTQAEPDLAGTFSCAAHVCTYGDGNERPMEAMLEATSPALNAMDACNDGFVRDDAILVVTFITDEEDAMKSPGDPQDWYDGLLANKGGDPDAVAVLGLFGDGDLPGGECPPLTDDVGAEPSPRLRAFVELFGDRGVAGSVCADDFIPFFLEAVDVVDFTCDEFRPEG